VQTKGTEKNISIPHVYQGETGVTNRLDIKSMKRGEIWLKSTAKINLRRSSIYSGKARRYLLPDSVFGFRVSGFGIQDLGFGFQVSRFGIRY